MGKGEITLQQVKRAERVTVDGKRRLYLSNVSIATFPMRILELDDLDELDLDSNLLKEIPDTIDKFVNLRLLDLHTNYLEQIPPAIGRLQNLQTLNLCNNRLTTSGLPRELELLSKLRILNLGLNRIETVPTFLAALKQLRELGLFDNLLTMLPKCILNLPKLQKINIKTNLVHPNEPPKYLVSEDRLCTDCFEKCTTHSRIAPEPKKSMFAGLETENSVAQTTDEPPKVDCIQTVEGLYVVREDRLCTDCLMKCKTDMETLDSRIWF